MFWPVNSKLLDKGYIRRLCGGSQSLIYGGSCFSFVYSQLLLLLQLFSSLLVTFAKASSIILFSLMVLFDSLHQALLKESPQLPFSYCAAQSPGQPLLSFSEFTAI